MDTWMILVLVILAIFFVWLFMMRQKSNNMVNAIFIGRSSCPACQLVKPVWYNWQQTNPVGVIFVEYDLDNMPDNAKNDIVAKYNVTKVPQIVLDNDKGYYSVVGGERSIVSWNNAVKQFRK